MEEPSIVPFKKKKKRAINSFRHARQTCDFSRWGKNLLHLIIQFPPIFSQRMTIDIYLIFKYHMCYKNRKKQILSYRCDVNMDERAKI